MLMIRFQAAYPGKKLVSPAAAPPGKQSRVARKDSSMMFIDISDILLLKGSHNGLIVSLKLVRKGVAEWTILVSFT